MKLASLKIGDLNIRTPIIQGGMGIGVSLSHLASAVANEGAVGIISGVQIGFKEPDFITNSNEANIRALKKEIRKAKELSPNGVIGVNLMVAMQNYEEMARAAVESDIDIIISGAGLPKSLPEFVKGTKTKIAPIVSSGRAAKIICKLWDRRYSYTPDFIIAEGAKAGGHLGFTLNELKEEKTISLKNLIKEVIEETKYFSEKYQKQIPVIAAGGIYSGKDIVDCMKAGASGIQMATRFICTHECDADIKYKKVFLNCSKDDIKIIQSPVGLPGRAIRNKFVKKIERSKQKIDKCSNCLGTCDPRTTQYCITKALINAVTGNIDEGILFTGSNGYRMDKIISVKELLNTLLKEVSKAYE